MADFRHSSYNSARFCVLVPLLILIVVIYGRTWPDDTARITGAENSRVSTSTSNLENYWTKDTVDAHIVYKSPRLRVEERTRKVGKDILRNWVWAAAPESVNVLVHLEEGNRYVVFNQTKYGYHGYSLAPVGGYIESGETPKQAAVREVREEMHCNPKEVISFGEFRVDVNRGFGKIHQFLAKDCRKLPRPEAYKSDDIEPQSKVLLSKTKLKQALVRGAFKEVKWAHVVAMSLLH